MEEVKQSIFVLKSNDIIPIEFFEKAYHLNGVLISMCVKGSVELRVNEEKKSILRGNLVTVLPQSIVNIESEISENAQFYCILFRLSDIADLVLPTNYNFLNELVKHPIIDLSSLEYNMCHNYYNLLFENSLNSYSVFHNDAIKYLLYSFIAQINIFYNQCEEELVKSSKKEVLVFQFYNLVHQYYIQERSVQFYADQLKLTPKYLTTLIRKRTGQSISKIIIDLVILKAKSYLSATTININQVADNLMFADTTTFSRYFKKYTGNTPSEYRKLHQ
ncbi:helix-turn-helix domain-containing protein [Myroides injenensis]|uniref:helix-turn-helix domain-containing protein n=1 Tax=Myroides injenensis TaxID=1183151 RepID=UPI0002884747|nr:helix-turn-helix transcriptional regulator [Myroides injenensis]